MRSFGAIVSVTIMLGVTAVVAVRGEEPALTPAQREEVAKLIAAFRQNRNTPKNRPPIVEKLLKFGAPAVKQLDDVVEAELQTAMEPYRAALGRQATETLKKQAAGTKPETIRQLQTKVLALRNREDLSKETIVQEVDPAIKQLAAVALLDLDKVLQSSSKLASQRTKLIELGRTWERCAAYQWENTPAAEGKPTAPPSFNDYLRAQEELAALLTTPLDKDAHNVLAANTKLASRIDADEAKAVLRCNLSRVLLGLRPLAIDLKLTAAARDHSTDMEKLRFFDHISPVQGKRTPTDRAQRFGADGAGENIFMGSKDGGQAHDAWFHSPGHFKNLLGDDYRRIGVGRHDGYFTQMFGR